MINRSVFDREMGILADCFHHDVAAPTLDRYYELLSPRMTTAQFAAACRRASMTPGGFWPKPGDLLPPIHERRTLSELEAAATQEQLPAGTAPLRLTAGHVVTHSR